MSGISNHVALPYIRLCAANNRNSIPPDRATVRCDIFIANSWPAQQRKKSMGDFSVCHGVEPKGVAASEILGLNCMEGHSKCVLVVPTSR